MNHKVALLIGRFQPFHKGHLYLLKKALKVADKVVIGIGSSNITDVNNPIDYETRRKIIRAVAYKEKFDNRIMKIVPLDDFYNDKKWLKNVEEQVGKFNLVVGNNDWVNEIMKSARYEIMHCPYYRRNLYEGWRIRKLIKEGKQWSKRIPNYLSYFFTSHYPLITNHYNHVVLGGTFDHFHKGHKALIDKAFAVSKNITIGLATEKLYKNKLLYQSIESFDQREKNIRTYCQNKMVDDRIQSNFKIISFGDIYGPILVEKNIDAIVVSRETLPNALKINEKRKKINFKPLQIIIIEDELADDGKIISSERIRLGEIDRDGNVYGLLTNHQPLVTSHYLKMPEKIRPELQKPLGKVFKTAHQVVKFIKFIKPIQVIAVGDIIVDSLLKEGFDPDVKIIDFRSRRQVIPRSPSIQLRINSATRDLAKRKYINKPGTINIKTTEKLKKLIHQSISHPKGVQARSWVIIDGEEDLLTLPAILFAPLGSLILYGHWQHGIIGVEITEEIKQAVKVIIGKFS